jgi:hypothetical protein
MKIVSNFLKSFTSSNKSEHPGLEETTSNINKEIIESIVLRPIKIARTKTGIPALWESYSEFDNNLIRSTIIVNADGKIKNSVFVKNRKNKQALVPIEAGDCIIKAFRDNIGIAISVLVINEISSSSNEATIYPTYRKPSESSVEDCPYPAAFRNAITMAISKLTDDELVLCELDSVKL